MYSGTLLISKRYIALLHFLSAYNSLFVRYKVYSTDPRKCLCTSWRYAETYENFRIDPAPFRKNPIKIKINCPIKLSVPTTRRKLHWNMSVTAKVCLVWYLLLRKKKMHWDKSVTAKILLKNLVRNVPKENKLWKKTFKSAVS